MGGVANALLAILKLDGGRESIHMTGQAYLIIVRWLGNVAGVSSWRVLRIIMFMYSEPMGIVTHST
jgi:hypothetical protein